MFTQSKPTLRIFGKNNLNDIFSFLRDFSYRKCDNKDAHETLCILLYIISLHKISRLKYPLTIEKHESPDFLVFYNGDTEAVGIEHSQATLGQFKIAEKEFRKRPDGSIMEPLFYSPFRELSKTDINIGIRSPDEELKGAGSAGHNIEIEWIEVIRRSISNKIKLLNQEHFRTFPENELIIEDQSPTKIAVEYDVAFDMLANLKNELGKESYKLSFDKIHVLTCNTFVYDFFNENIAIDVSKKNLNGLLENNELAK